MKKILTLILLLGTGLCAQSQTYNFFPGSDGWLWFDTENIVSRYTGLINESQFRIAQGENEKIVQLVYADQIPDYPATEADINILGAGTDGETGSEGSRRGALVLQPSSAISTANGGGFVLCLPSCATLSIDYSSNSRVMARIVATTNPNADMNKVAAGNSLEDETGWKIISAAYMSPFKRLPSGRNQWTGIEKLNNGSDETTIQSDKPIYVWFQSATRDTIYIHGVQVTTPKQETTAVDRVAASSANEQVEVYAADGRRIGGRNALPTLRKGFYLVREGDRTRKVLAN